jgi:Carboxypeptidase regulatory-like domain
MRFASPVHPLRNPRRIPRLPRGARSRSRPRRAGACLLVAGVLLSTACRRHDLTAPAQVRGRVLSASGRVLSGARAVLERDTEGRTVEVASAALGPKGEFTLEGVPAGRYLLRTEAPGYATVTVPVELAPGDSLATSLRFEPEQLLEGTVEDGRGKALPDALVLAWPTGKRQARVVEATSDREGHFTLAGLARGSWTLLAESPGFGTLQLDRVDVPSRQLVLRLEGDSRSLGGMVMAGSQAVAGATVYLGNPALRTPRMTTTDKRGTFLFHGVGLGKYTLRAAHERLASMVVHQIIDEGTGWLPPFRLALEPGAFVEGRVMDDLGRPLPATPLELIAAPSDDIPRATSTDPGGRFTVGPVPPGRYQLVARAPAHVLMETYEVRLRSEGTPSVELRLIRASRLSGRVVDESGRPLPAVAVTAVAVLGRGPAADELTVLAGSLPLAVEAAGLPAEALVHQGKTRTTTSDTQGRFVLDDVPPSRIRLELAHPDRLPFRREPILLGPGEYQDLGNLPLQPGAVIAGRVLDDGGRPIEGARVEARPAKGPAVRMATDRDGRFFLRVPAGDYSLLALAPSRAPRSVFALHAAPGTRGAPFELRLMKADGSLEGQVRDDKDRPVSRAAVLALVAPIGAGVRPGTPWRPRSSEEMENPTVALTLTSAATDSLGRFRLHGLPSEPVILEVRHFDWPPVAVVARVGERVSLQLSRPGGIEGEIREKGSGAFVASCDLDLVGPQGRRPERIERQGAGFSAVGLQPGRWLIKVASPGFAPAEQAVEVPPGASRREPSLGGVLVELSRLAVAR